MAIQRTTQAISQEEVILLLRYLVGRSHPDWWSSPYMKDLIPEFCRLGICNTDEPKEVIPQLASSLLDRFKKENRKRKFYPNTKEKLKTLASYRRIIDLQESEKGSTGSLNFDVIEGGFKVEYRTDSNSVRRLFSIAHEIGHTFLFDVSTHIPDPLIPLEKMGDGPVEGFCHDFASALLVPEGDFLEVIDEVDLIERFNLGCLEQIKKRLGVSLEYIIRRAGKLSLLCDPNKFFVVISINPRTEEEEVYISSHDIFESWGVHKIIDIPHVGSVKKELSTLSQIHFRRHPPLACDGIFHKFKKIRQLIGFCHIPENELGNIDS